MYTSYYHLRERAFETRPKSSFIWLGQSRQEVVDGIANGIITNKELLLLTGEEGVGKSILLHSILKRVEERVRMVLINNNADSSLQFYNKIAKGFDIATHIESQPQLTVELRQVLQEIVEQGKTALLVIDNAHTLHAENYKDIRILLGLNRKENNHLLTILLVGQKEAARQITLPNNSELHQRLAYYKHLKPLNLQETREYIAHRLAKAGAERQIFDEVAFASLLLYSGGLPRLLNTFCTAILEEGTQQKETLIDASFIDWMFGNHSEMKKQAVVQAGTSRLHREEKKIPKTENLDKDETLQLHSLKKPAQVSTINKNDEIDEGLSLPPRPAKIPPVFVYTSDEHDDGLALDIDNPKDKNGENHTQPTKNAEVKPPKALKTWPYHNANLGQVSNSSKRNKRKRNIFPIFLRGGLILATCFFLYFLYQKLTLPTISTGYKKQMNVIQNGNEQNKLNKSIVLENLEHGIPLYKIPTNGSTTVIRNKMLHHRITIQPLLIVE